MSVPNRSFWSGCLELNIASCPTSP